MNKNEEKTDIASARQQNMHKRITFPFTL